MASKVEYKWADGARIKADAQAVGEELSRYRATTADAVLVRARQRDSALHAAFNWDDASAAHEHRLLQARQILGSLRRIVVNVTTREPEVRRVFVGVQSNDDASRYVNTQKMKDDERERFLAQLKGELRAWARRNAEFRDESELAPVFSAIEALGSTTADKAVA